MVLSQQPVALVQVEVVVVDRPVHVQGEPGDRDVAGSSVVPQQGARDVVDDRIPRLGAGHDRVVVQQREGLQLGEARIGASPDDQLGSLVPEALKHLGELRVVADGEPDLAEVRFIDRDVLLSGERRRLQVELGPVREDLVVHADHGARAIDEDRGVEASPGSPTIDGTDDVALVLPRELRHRRDRRVRQRLHDVRAAPRLGQGDEVDALLALRVDDARDPVEACRLEAEAHDPDRPPDGRLDPGIPVRRELSLGDDRHGGRYGDGQEKVCRAPHACSSLSSAPLGLGPTTLVPECPPGRERPQMRFRPLGRPVPPTLRLRGSAGRACRSIRRASKR